MLSFSTGESRFSEQVIGILLLGLAAFAAFWKLGAFPIMMFDESRFAINAWEMSLNGNILVPQYLGEPDLWNSKPPLTAILQALSIKLLGPSSFAVRLPSALAVVATTWMLWTFCKNILKRLDIGIFAVLTLLASQGYMAIHVARTGDADALLVCFVTLYALSWFSFLHAGHRKYLFLFGLGILLAGWTKGIAGLMPLSGLAVFTLVSGNFVAVIKDKRVYLTVFLALAGIAGYYFLREMLNPGYLKVVWENELGGRFMASTQVVKNDWSFYIENLFPAENKILPNRFSPFVFLLPFCLVLALFSKNSLLKKAGWFGISFSLCFLFIISLGKTKHHWYDAPVYPVFALMTGLVLGELGVMANRLINKRMQLILCLVWVSFLFIPSGYIALKKATNPAKVSLWEVEGGFIQHIDRKFPELNTIYIYKKVQHEFHYAQIHFYINTLNTLKGKNLILGKEAPSVGETVISCQEKEWQQWEKSFQLKVIEEQGGCRLIQVLSPL